MWNSNWAELGPTQLKLVLSFFLYYLYIVAFMFCHIYILSLFYIVTFVFCLLSYLRIVFLYFVGFAFCLFAFCRICILSYLYSVFFVFCHFCILSFPELCFDRIVKYQGIGQKLFNPKEITEKNLWQRWNKPVVNFSLRPMVSTCLCGLQAHKFNTKSVFIIHDDAR